MGIDIDVKREYIVNGKNTTAWKKCPSKSGKSLIRH